MISVSTIVDMPGLQHKIEYFPAEVEAMADRLIELAIENFKKPKVKLRLKYLKLCKKLLLVFQLRLC